MTLRQNLLALRSFYFLSFGALGALYPFFPLLFADRGLSPTQISWVMVLVPVGNFFVPPLWGVVADALRRRLLLLRVCCAGCATSVLLFFPQWGFWGAVAAMGVWAFFRAPIIPLGDAASYHAMGGQRELSFSQIRLFGSVGFALMVLTPGLAEGAYQVEIVLGVTAAACLLSGLATWPLPDVPPGREKKVLAQTVSTLKTPALGIFLLGNVAYYCGHSTYDAFFSLHVSNLGQSDAFVGIAWSLGVGVEIGVMLVAPRLMGRFRPVTLLAACALLAAIRWLLLAHVKEQSTILAAQTLHGFTFGLWYLAVVEHIQRRAPEHLRTSLQSMTLATLGLGMVVGYLSGGAILERYNGQTLYLCAAGAATVGLCLYAVAWLWGRERQHSRIS